MTQNSDKVLDPFEQLRVAMAAEARERVLKKPHDKTTWRYKKRPPLRFRASEAGACGRRIWYRLMGYVPTPDSPDLMMKQLWGNLAQDVVRGLFHKHGIKIGGVEFQSDGTQKETLDARHDFDVDGTAVKVAARADGDFDADTLFEFKTLNERKHYWMKQAFAGHWDKYGKGNDAAVAYIKNRYAWYYDQVQVTSAIFGKSQTLFGFMNRDSVQYDHYMIAADPEKLREVLLNFAVVQRGVQTETPPPPILSGSMECTWCPFHYQCHGKTERGGKVVYPSEPD